MQDFHGKVAVVTGGGNGIGKACALTWAREGMDVAVVDIQQNAAEGVAQEIRRMGRRAVAILVDVTDRKSVGALADRVYAEMGKVNVLHANAGVASRAAGWMGHDEHEWRWLVNVNLFGVVYTYQTFLPRMVQSGEEGHIITTSSHAGLVPGADAYGATKYAVLGITEGLSAQLANTKIKASVLCPGQTATDIYYNSATGRPEQYGGPRRARTLAELQAQGRAWGGLQDPMELARRVVKAVKEERLYIFPRPDQTAMPVLKRFTRIMEDMEKAWQD